MGELMVWSTKEKKRMKIQITTHSVYFRCLTSLSFRDRDNMVNYAMFLLTNVLH